MRTLVKLNNMQLGWYVMIAMMAAMVALALLTLSVLLVLQMHFLTLELVYSLVQLATSEIHQQDNAKVS